MRMLRCAVLSQKNVDAPSALVTAKLREPMPSGFALATLQAMDVKTVLSATLSCPEGKQATKTTTKEAHPPSDKAQHLFLIQRHLHDATDASKHDGHLAAVAESLPG